MRPLKFPSVFFSKVLAASNVYLSKLCVRQCIYVRPFNGVDVILCLLLMSYCIEWHLLDPSSKVVDVACVFACCVHECVISHFSLDLVHEQ